MRRMISAGARAVASAALIAAVAAAALAAQAAPARAAAGLAGSSFERYRLELTSAWPELDARPGCGIGGGERLNGELEREGGDRYGGILERAAQLRFCGRHAGQAEPCEARLEAAGPVRAAGAIRRDRTGLVLALALIPIPDRTTVQVRGDCMPAFLDRLAALYRSAGRFLEIPLPLPGAAGRLQAGLEDYGWRVAVEGLAARGGSGRRAGLAAD